MFGRILLYKTGTSTITQEAFSILEALFVYLDYYCIRPVLVPLLRRHSPYLKHCLCIWILLYKTGTSTITQEAFSILEALFVYLDWKDVLSMALGAK